MKRFLILFIIMAFPFTMHAENEQGYLPKPGVVWTMGYFSPYIKGEVSFIESKLEGDTLIGDIVFKKQYERVLIQSEENTSDWKATDCFVGQDKGKVYFYDKTYYKEPLLLMDFSATIGEIIPYNSGGMSRSLIVINVTDTVFACSTDKQARKCVYVKDVDSSVSDVWIEGVGSLKYGIEPFFMEPITGGVPLLIKCSNGDIVMYENPSPTDINHPVVQNKNVTTFNLQGQRVESVPRKGVYIQNGKKVVIKIN